jgi:hypothetical protein
MSHEVVKAVGNQKFCSLLIVFPWYRHLQSQPLLGIGERVTGCGRNCRDSGPALDLGARSLDDSTKR